MSIRSGRLVTLFRKEVLDLMRNRAALVPVVLVSLIALAMPFTVAIVVPRITHQSLSGETDLLRLSRVLDKTDGLSDAGRVQLLLFQQFLFFFLLMPITGAMSLAAHAIVGEKQARTLEPLLATPVSTFELLVAKTLGALTPTLAISTAALVLYFAGIGITAEPGVAGAMITARSLLLVLVVAPIAALVSLQFAVLVSSRVNDARTAQQFGVLIILPLTALFVAQFSGVFWLTATMMGFIAAVLLVAWVLLAVVSVAIFDRETILTRWR